MRKFLYLSFITLLAISVSKTTLAEECADDEVLGAVTHTCIKKEGTCGTRCNYSVDAQGNARIYGTGTVQNYFGNSDFINITIEEGITAIGYATFSYGTGNAIQSVSLPNSLTTIDTFAFRYQNSRYMDSLILPANTQLPDTYGVGNAGPGANKVYCAAGNTSCEKISDTRRYLYEKDGDNYVVYHNDEIVEIFGSLSDFKQNKLLEGEYIKKDSHGNPIAAYNNHGALLATYDTNGSVYYYDTQGNLTKVQKRGPFTIEEADALTKKGNVNKFTITW